MSNPSAPAPYATPDLSADTARAIRCAAATGGYAWWYVEAHDNDAGRYGLTLIVFAGAVFSPAYASRLRAGEPATGLDHPAVNFALYEREGGPFRQRLWVMNEYDRSALQVGERGISVGKSSITYTEDGATRIELHEESTRFFGRPGPRLDAWLEIVAPPPSQPPLLLGRNDRGEEHLWQPLAVAGSVEVRLRWGDRELGFRGVAYCDRNFGSGRLENAFSRWSWAHGVGEEPGQERAALVLYRAERLDGGLTALAVRYDDAGRRPIVRHIDDVSLSTSGRPGGFLWLPVPSLFSVGDAHSERLPRGQLLDAPFYARYMTRLRDGQHGYLGVGEYLDLRRFAGRGVQRLLRYKTRQVPP